jgi:DNA repair protein RecO (recombination protein O)
MGCLGASKSFNIMSIKETEALVIKSHNLSEADRIVVFFTREHGVVRGVAKGAKRLHSRFGSTLEPFSTVNLTYFQKEDRELVSIQNVELTRSRFDVASDPAFLETYSYIADLLTAFALPHDADEKLYRMISACISAEVHGEELDVVRLYFELWLLRLSGLLPDWTCCENCERELDIRRNAYLMTSFHLRCEQCRQRHTFAEVSPNELRLYQDIQRLAPAALIESAKDKLHAVTSISGVTRRLIAQALGREVATSSALR